jgi:plastocyanin
MTPRPHARLLLAVTLSLACALGAAACGDDEPDAAGSGTTAPDAGGGDYGGGAGGSEEGKEGTIVAKDFSLSDLTVAPGEEIYLKNEGGTTHSATADEGEFDLGAVKEGETSEPGTAPDEPGEYAFHCEFHDSMTATLTVEE